MQGFTGPIGIVGRGIARTVSPRSHRPRYHTMEDLGVRPIQQDEYRQVFIALNFGKFCLLFHALAGTLQTAFQLLSTTFTTLNGMQYRAREYAAECCSILLVIFNVYIFHVSTFFRPC